MRYPVKTDSLQTWATWISNLFHPIGSSSFVFLILIAFSDQRLALKLAWIGITVSCTFIIPITILYGQKGRCNLDGERTEHFISLLAGILCYTFGFLCLSALSAPDIIQGLMFCNVVNTLIITGITAWWKISVDSTQISSALIALYIQWGVGMLPFLTLIPILGAAKVFLRKNTPAQVCVGALIGLVGTIFQLQVLFHQSLGVFS